MAGGAIASGDRAEYAGEEMNAGYRIVRAISEANLVKLVKREDPLFPNGHYFAIVWSSGAEEQLDALVEDMIRERLEANEVVRRAIDEGEK
jgi:hypothetical protein